MHVPDDSICDVRHRSWPQALMMLAVGAPLVILIARAPGRTILFLSPLVVILVYVVVLFFVGLRYRVQRGLRCRKLDGRAAILVVMRPRGCDWLASPIDRLRFGFPSFRPSRSSSS